MTIRRRASDAAAAGVYRLGRFVKERLDRTEWSAQRWVTGFFAHPRPHEEMVADERRTDGFRRAIEATVRPGQVVVDIGAGTGVLSLFAARAGARRVYAVEASEPLAAAAREVARANGLGSQVEFVVGNSKAVSLPERGDVLVIELLGNGAVDEDIMALALDARRRLLEPGAAVIPASFEVLVAPVESTRQFAGFWQEPRHGLDFSALGRLYEGLAGVTRDREGLLSAPRAVFECALASHESDAMPMASVEFEAERDGALHGFLMHFRATLAPGIVLDTSERPEGWSWQSNYFGIGAPEAVRRGDRIRLEIGWDSRHGWRRRHSTSAA